MKKILIFIFISLVFGCTVKNTSAGLLIDNLEKELALPTHSNLHLVNNPELIKTICINMNDKKYMKIIFEDGKRSIEESFTMDKNNDVFEYDELSRLKSIKIVNNGVVFWSTDYIYKTDENGNKQKEKYVNSNLESVITEYIHKNTYTYKELFKNNNEDTIKLSFKGNKLIEYYLYSKIYQSKITYEYNKNNLIKMSQYSGDKLIFTFEYTYNTNNNLLKLICYRHNISPEKTMEYEHYYEDFDIYGNWKRYTDIDKSGNKTIITRDFEYK